MRTKVLALELSEKLSPLWGGAEYDSFWVLVRYHHQPLGWVWVSIPDSNSPMVSVEQLRHEIATQLGSWLSRRLLEESLSSEATAEKTLEPISVVVCAHSHPEQLQRCLESLLSSDYPNYEVIVVDNTPSSIGIAEKVESFSVRYVREHQPGLSQARNRGFAEARHDIVAFVQDNMCVDAQWLYTINKAFAEPEVTAITGLIAPSELETVAQFLYEFDYTNSFTGNNLRRQVIRQGTLSESDLIKGKYGTCSNAAFRRNLLTAVGLFDTTLDTTMTMSDASDMEMLHRLVSEGHTLVYEPSLLAWRAHPRHFSLLHQQLFTKASSLGCYFLSSWQSRSIQQGMVWQLFFKEWAKNWVLRNLVRPPRKLPRYVALIELAGMLTSPLTYWSGQNNATGSSLRTDSKI